MDRRLRAADLDVPDLLLLKLVYGLLQLPGGPCGIHGGSLELAFSLMGEQMNIQHFAKHIRPTRQVMAKAFEKSTGVLQCSVNIESQHYPFVLVDLTN